MFSDQYWSVVDPSLHFISHLPSNVVGEQLVAQFLRSVPDQQWLFKYGRVPMSFILNEHVWKVWCYIFPACRCRSNSVVKRLTAKFDDKERCKLSLIAEATTEYSTAVSPEKLQPFDLQFHPVRSPIPGAPDNRGHNTKRHSKPMQAVSFVPLEEQVLLLLLHDIHSIDICYRQSKGAN